MAKGWSFLAKKSPYAESYLPSMSRNKSICIQLVIMLRNNLIYPIWYAMEVLRWKCSKQLFPFSARYLIKRLKQRILACSSPQCLTRNKSPVSWCAWSDIFLHKTPIKWSYGLYRQKTIQMIAEILYLTPVTPSFLTSVAYKCIVREMSSLIPRFSCTHVFYFLSADDIHAESVI